MAQSSLPWGGPLPESRRAFESQLDKLNLQIPGFRSASKAPTNLLARPVQGGLLRSDEFAAAALKIWAESNEELRRIIQERIEDVGPYLDVSVEYPDFSGTSLRGHWPNEAWERESGRFAQLNENLDEDDIALMMCYVTSRLPGITGSEQEADAPSMAVEQSPDVLKLLALCAVDLEDLPVSAPEWESDIPELADRIAEVVGSKREERSRAATLDSFIE